MKVYLKMRREGGGRASDLVAGERVALLCVYLVGGTLWGLLTGAAIGWVLSVATIVPFSTGFAFGVLLPVLFRAGKWLSGSLVDETNHYLRGENDERAISPSTSS